MKDTPTEEFMHENGADGANRMLRLEHLLREIEKRVQGTPYSSEIGKVRLQVKDLFNTFVNLSRETQWCERIKNEQLKKAEITKALNEAEAAVILGVSPTGRAPSKLSPAAAWPFSPAQREMARKALDAAETTLTLDAVKVIMQPRRAGKSNPMLIMHDEVPEENDEPSAVDAFGNAISSEPGLQLRVGCQGSLDEESGEVRCNACQMSWDTDEEPPKACRKK